MNVLATDFIKKTLITSLLLQQGIRLKLPEDIFSIGKLNLKEILSILEDTKFRSMDSLGFHIFNLLCEDIESDLNKDLPELPIFPNLRPNDHFVSGEEVYVEVMRNIPSSLVRRGNGFEIVGFTKTKVIKNYDEIPNSLALELEKPKLPEYHFLAIFNPDKDLAGIHYASLLKINEFDNLSNLSKVNPKFLEIFKLNSLGVLSELKLFE